MTKGKSKWRLARLHALPSITGLARLFWQHPLWTAKLLRARLNYFVTRRLPGALATPDGFVLQTPNELISYWTFFVEREGWSRQWVDLLRQQSNPFVLDVGANAGVFSYWIWTLNPGTEFFAFEPLPKMAEKIQAWQQRTGARLTLQKAAVSDHSGTSTFYAAADNDTSASLRPGLPKTMELVVPLVTLDSVVPDRPVLLAKIDVEGCESEALAGGQRTLVNTRFLLIEAHTEEALAKIRSRLPSSDWDYRQIAPSDYLFIRR